MTWVATDIIPWYAKQYVPPHSVQAITELANPPAVAPSTISQLGT
jgi:hypothetical protein